MSQKFLTLNIRAIQQSILSLIIVLLVAALSHLVLRQLLSTVAFLSLYPAIILIAWRFSFVPAVIGVLAATLSAGFLLTNGETLNPFYLATSDQLQLAFFFLVSTSIVRLINKGNEDRKALEKALKELRHLSFRYQQAQEEERMRISKEIHDDLGQSLTVLKMQVFLIKKFMNPDSEGLNKLNQILKSIESIIQNMRSFVADLRPASLENLGIVATAQWWLQGIQSRTGIQFHFKSEFNDSGLSTERSTVIFRILQEAVTNAIRHAESEKVDVLFSSIDNLFVMEIRDYGKGIDLEKLTSYRSSGLSGMRERLLPYSGTLKIENLNGSGTRLKVFLPLA
jgi:signal transduction histidine kinase